MKNCDTEKNDTVPDSKILLYVLALIVFGLLMCLMSGCSSTSDGINWQQVIIAIQEYKDDIPYDKIQDALDKIKEK